MVAYDDFTMASGLDIISAGEWEAGSARHRGRRKAGAAPGMLYLLSGLFI